MLEFLMTYLLTPWSKVLPEKIAYYQLVKKFPAFYATQLFITAFTSAHHLSLPHARSVPSSHFLKIHLSIILQSTPGSFHSNEIQCFYVDNN